MTKPIFWNDHKNSFLKEKRGFSFEDIVTAIQQGQLLSSRDHPKYSHQRIFEVNLNGYVIVVPYVEDEDKIFFKNSLLFS